MVNPVVFIRSTFTGSQITWVSRKWGGWIGATMLKSCRSPPQLIETIPMTPGPICGSSFRAGSIVIPSPSTAAAYRA